MACLYQNMMMQQGPMAWMQAMCSQQQNGSQYLPNDQVHTHCIQYLLSLQVLDISFPG